MPKYDLRCSILPCLYQFTEMVIDPASIAEVCNFYSKDIQFICYFVAAIQQIRWFMFRWTRNGLPYNIHNYQVRNLIIIRELLGHELFILELFLLLLSFLFLLLFLLLCENALLSVRLNTMNLLIYFDSLLLLLCLRYLSRLNNLFLKVYGYIWLLFLPKISRQEYSLALCRYESRHKFCASSPILAVLIWSLIYIEQDLFLVGCTF